MKLFCEPIGQGLLNTLYSELRQTHPVHITQGYNLEEIYDNDPELLGIENLDDLDDLAELDLEEDLEAGDMVNGDSLDILNAVEGEPEPTVSRLAREAAKKVKSKSIRWNGHVADSILGQYQSLCRKFDALDNPNYFDYHER